MAGHLINLAHEPVKTAAIAVAAGGLAAIVGAFYFQYALGMHPCPLCLDQRIAYYVSIPLAVLVALGASVGASRKVLIAALVAITGFMVFNAGLGAYHAGIEWKFWAGPADCSGPLNSLGSTGGLLRQLQDIRVVRCDEAAWRFLGLSLAGWNVLISLALAGIALWGARAAYQRRAEN